MSIKRVMPSLSCILRMSLMQNMGDPELPQPCYTTSMQGPDLMLKFSEKTPPISKTVTNLLNNIDKTFGTGAVYVFIPERAADRCMSAVLDAGYRFHRHQQQPCSSLVYYKWLKQGYPERVQPYATSSDRFGAVVFDPSGTYVLTSCNEGIMGACGPIGRRSWGCPTSHVSNNGTMFSVRAYVASEFGISIDSSGACAYVCGKLVETSKYDVIQDRLDVFAVKAIASTNTDPNRARWVAVHSLVQYKPLIEGCNETYLVLGQCNDETIYIVEHLRWILKAASGTCRNVRNEHDGALILE